MSAPTEIVRWGQPPFAFELATRDAEIAARARTLFAPWPAPPTRPHASFAIDRLDGGPPPSPAKPHDAERSSEVWEARSLGSGESRQGSAAEALRWVELTALLSFVDDVSSAIAVHGALIDLEGRGALVVGPPQAGKSSLACALWQAGASLLSDDVALLDLGSACARPGPRRVALRHASRGLVGEDLWQRIVTAPSSAPTDDGLCFHPREIDGQSAPTATHVGAVVFLAREARPELPPAGLARIAPAHAVLAWLPYLIGQGRLQPGDAIRRIAPFAERVPTFDLERGPLGEMVGAVRRSLPQGAAS